VFAMNVTATLGTEPASMSVLQVSGHSSLSIGRETYMQAGPCASYVHRGAGWML